MERATALGRIVISTDRDFLVIVAGPPQLAMDPRKIDGHAMGGLVSPDQAKQSCFDGPIVERPCLLPGPTGIRTPVQRIMLENKADRAF
jgi:hypothetical protein